MNAITQQKQRQRAPSKRSLETRARIFDAAEQIFAAHGFDAATIRDIAALAGVQGALVHHHGGSKEALFAAVVARRAAVLSNARTAALTALQAKGDVTLRGVICCFTHPFLDRVLGGDPGWLAYGRLIAYVSADDRWRAIASQHFDPTAKVFLAAFAQVLPGATPARLAAALVYMVSGMLSLCASRWRIDDLSGQGDDTGDLVQMFTDFSEAGFRRAVQG